jgi:hypothetical protein
MKKEKLCVCAVFCVQKCMCVYVYIYIYCVNVGGGREEERLPSLLPQHTLHTPHTHIYLPTHTPLHTHTHPTRSLHILYTPLLPPTNRIFFGYPTLLPPNVRRIKTFSLCPLHSLERERREHKENILIRGLSAFISVARVQPRASEASQTCYCLELPITWMI